MYFRNFYKNIVSEFSHYFNRSIHFFYFYSIIRLLFEKEGDIHMNILLINGSPKKGKSNTYKLAASFIEGIISSSTKQCSVEELNVYDLEINPCSGCFACWNKTPGKCIWKDDMPSVLEKMLWADITIWSFPLYYFNVPGKLKLLIDRQLPFALPFMDKESENGGHPSRYDMSQKKHVLISTCGFYTTKGNYDSILPMFDHFLGKGRYETIFCSQGELFRVPELSQRTSEYLEYVKNAGQEYCSGNISTQTREKLNTLLFPKEVFEAMADASWGIDQITGETSDESLIFTKQMAALYNKNSYTGKDLVLEMNYTDIEKTYQVVLKKDGFELLTESFLKYTTKIETPFTVWKDIASGKIHGDEALAQQLYKVKGDFSIMLHWNKFFGHDSANANASQHNHVSRTNMLILLLPWTVFWIGTSINALASSYICILLCAIMPLIFYKNKKTFYDIISGTIILLLSAWNIYSVNLNLILPLSYLSFGLLWTLSCFTKIPLTAHYSANNYNGDEAFHNPIFMKTNKILTLAWGILYLLTFVITIFLMQTPIAPYLGSLNSILPAGMGIFTAWFQKWYPAKIARG